MSLCEYINTGEGRQKVDINIICEKKSNIFTNFLFCFRSFEKKYILREFLWNSNLTELSDCRTAFACGIRLSNKQTRSINEKFGGIENSCISISVANDIQKIRVLRFAWILAGNKIRVLNEVALKNCIVQSLEGRIIQHYCDNLGFTWNADYKLRSFSMTEFRDMEIVLLGERSADLQKQILQGTVKLH